MSPPTFAPFFRNGDGEDWRNYPSPEMARELVRVVQQMPKGSVLTLGRGNRWLPITAAFPGATDQLLPPQIIDNLIFFLPPFLLPNIRLIIYLISPPVSLFLRS